MTRANRSRDLPKPYIETALTFFRDRNLRSIVEIGSMRMPLDHPIDEIGCGYCMDGHSSVFWAAETDDLVSVDIDPDVAGNAAAVLERLFKRTDAVRCMDGIEFLKARREPIDLLYLDAWDAKLPESAQNHLDAFLAAEGLLHERSIVLIDDTDVEPDGHGGVRPSANGLEGKGKFVVEHMRTRGWSIVFSGRQTLLARDISPAEIAQVRKTLARRKRKTGWIPGTEPSVLKRLLARFGP